MGRDSGEVRTNILLFVLIWFSPWIESTRKTGQVEADDRPDAVDQSEKA